MSHSANLYALLSLLTSDQVKPVLNLIQSYVRLKLTKESLPIARPTEGDNLLLTEKVTPRNGLPPLLTALSERKPERLHYLGGCGAECVGQSLMFPDISQKAGNNRSGSGSRRILDTDSNTDAGMMPPELVPKKFAAQCLFNACMCACVKACPMASHNSCTTSGGRQASCPSTSDRWEAY